MQHYLLALIAVPLLAACTSVPEQPAMCDAAPAQSHLGKPYSEALGKQLQELTGATILRAVHEGDPVTEDYRPERLTVVWNDDGKIIKMSCG
jgi:hypothetical protein